MKSFYGKLLQSQSVQVKQRKNIVVNQCSISGIELRALDKSW